MAHTDPRIFERRPPVLHRKALIENDGHGILPGADSPPTSALAVDTFHIMLLQLVCCLDGSHSTNCKFHYNIFRQSTPTPAPPPKIFWGPPRAPLPSNPHKSPPHFPNPAKRPPPPLNRNPPPFKFGSMPFLCYTPHNLGQPPCTCDGTART